jgi:lipopolysaccharide/colanic/teichoic acid biosynthesis glycosyltransferase
VRYSRFFKRFLDILLSSVGLLLLSLPLLLIVLWIKSDSNGPVFFIQKRLGLGGEIFSIFKFRTMNHRQRISTEQIFPDHPEVTKAGRILRRFKLDEIPQLINVLKGDMSTIGPRPCLPELQNKFDENGRARLKVRPGLFGLADIKGGYFLTWPQRWVHDRYYVEHLSLWLDIKLLFMALPVILFDEDFYLKRDKKAKMF